MRPARIPVLIGFGCLAAVFLGGCGVFNTSPPQAPEPAETAPRTRPGLSGPGLKSSATSQDGVLMAREADLKALREKIHSLEAEVSRLRTRVAQQRKIINTIEYADPVQLYNKARGLLLEGDTDTAGDLFTAFIKSHSDHELADNAMYWLGECHYTAGRYDQAITVFKNLVKTFPKAEKVPDALLKTGYAYLSMDDINRASHFLKKVLVKYPFSPAAEKAQIKLREIN